MEVTILQVLMKISSNLKKYLIFYSIGAIILGWYLGVQFSNFAMGYKAVFSKLIVFFVFFMIYPMMININWLKVKNIAKDPKAVLMSIFYNYILTPIIAFILAKLFIHDEELFLGFLLVMLIPVSSSSVGYTGIVKGSIEVASIAQAINFLLIPVLTPIYFHFIGKGVSIPIPMGQILKSLLYVVILPIVLGAITRWGLIKAKDENILIKLKPLFSFITLISMLFIIFTIFFLKGKMLLTKVHLVIILGIITLIYLIIALLLETYLNRKIGLSYEEHMGIVFLSTGKNNGTAVAIASLAFGPMVAIPAAVLPIFQIIFLIAYIHMENLIRKYFKNN